MRTCILALTAWLSLAASLPAIEVEWKSITATLYKDITTLYGSLSDTHGGVVQIYEPPAGKMLCGVTYHVLITWGKDTKFEIARKDYGIEGAIEIGALDEYGGLRINKPQDYEPGLQINYSYEGKANTYVRQHLFLLDAGTKEVTFKLGSKTEKLKLDKPPVSFDPTTSLSLQVVKTERHPKFDFKVDVDPLHLARLQSPLINPGGSILAVQVNTQIKTVGYDAFVTNNYGIGLDKFYLSFAKGGRATCLGCVNSAGYFNFNGPKFEGKNDRNTVTLLFAVPANVTAFEINYMGHPVGKVTAEVQP